MSADFDRYTGEYRTIINRVSRLSGGNYEYFAELRLKLLKRALASRSFVAPRRILDYGCGIGATALIMRTFFPESHIVGIDTSPESISAAAGLGIINAEFHCISPDDHTLGTSAFDLIYTNGTFHHIGLSLLPPVVDALRTSLTREGNLFVFENNPRNPLMMKAMRDNPFDEGAVAIAAGDMVRLLTGAGFRVLCQEYYAFFPTWLGPLKNCEPLLRAVPFGAQYLTWARSTMT